MKKIIAFIQNLPKNILQLFWTIVGYGIFGIMSFAATIITYPSLFAISLVASIYFGNAIFLFLPFFLFIFGLCFKMGVAEKDYESILEDAKFFQLCEKEKALLVKTWQRLRKTNKEKINNNSFSQIFYWKRVVKQDRLGGWFYFRKAGKKEFKILVKKLRSLKKRFI